MILGEITPDIPVKDIILSLKVRSYSQTCGKTTIAGELHSLQVWKVHPQGVSTFELPSTFGTLTLSIYSIKNA